MTTGRSRARLSALSSEGTMSRLSRLLVPLLAALSCFAGPQAQAMELGGVMPGTYECFAQEQYFFVRFGSDMTYMQSEPIGDSGLYEVDVASGIVRFTTGPYAVGQWTADIRNTPDRAGLILHADHDYECRGTR